MPALPLAKILNYVEFVAIMHNIPQLAILSTYRIIMQVLVEISLLNER